MSFVRAGFWGLKVEAGKEYSQTVDQHFVITMAALVAELPKNGTRTSITISSEDSSFVICSLTPGKIEQQIIDLTFLEGSEITIKNHGNCSIDLTGNYTVDMADSDDGYDSEGSEGVCFQHHAGTARELQITHLSFSPVSLESMDSNDRRMWLAEHGGMDDDSEMDEDSEADEVEIAEALNGKRKLASIPAASAATKKAKITEIVEEAAPKKAASTPATKKEIAAAKKAEAAAAKKAAAVASPKEAATPAKAVAKESPAAKKAATPVTAAAAASPKSVKKVLPNGLAIEDAVVGSGAQAKNGKKVGVRYIGRLAKNGKVFDSNTKGSVFKFKLGAGEVIKGWDLGVAGMNIGGTRKLTIPAALAYGSRGAPPDIPPNSVLEFEVKLLEVR
ncbi:hypothetical protein HKX48_005418 [Thoreauomyces humboldtii]|nr:hypothetical protein HKX48_005418 [Thoreauomyces humboldtii]